MEDDDELSFVALGVVTGGIVERLQLSLTRQADEDSAIQFLRLKEANTNEAQGHTGKKIGRKS